MSYLNYHRVRRGGKVHVNDGWGAFCGVEPGRFKLLRNAIDIAIGIVGKDTPPVIGEGE